MNINIPNQIYLGKIYRKYHCIVEITLGFSITISKSFDVKLTKYVRFVIILFYFQLNILQNLDKRSFLKNIVLFKFYRGVYMSQLLKSI